MPYSPCVIAGWVFPQITQRFKRVLTTHSVLFRQEPLWQENRIGTRHSLPKPVQSWTYEAGSLTQRLRTIYGAKVAVNVLFQGWRVPFLTERKLLHLHEQRLCLVREVLLHAENKPLILARTIIPAATIRIAGSLAHLGTRPLGEVIFSYHGLERVAMDVALVKPSIWIPDVLTAANIQQSVWGRRTVYAIKQRQMLVSEFFLPEIL
jgi:chorismate--pyruvate lyase